jgi:hypothetical protein
MGNVLSGSEAGLVGYWPCSDGQGQSLRGRAAGDRDGTLGSTESPEGNDPAWSSDGPPVD